MQMRSQSAVMVNSRNWDYWQIKDKNNRHLDHSWFLLCNVRYRYGCALVIEQHSIKCNFVQVSHFA